LNILFPVEHRQNNNEESKYFGKIYAVSTKRMTLNTPSQTVEDALAKGIDTVVDGVKMNFLPNNTDLLGLTSKKLKAKCSLVWNDVVEITRAPSFSPIKRFFSEKVLGIRKILLTLQEN